MRTFQQKLFLGCKIRKQFCLLLLYVQILFLDQRNFARVTSENKNPFKGQISAKLLIRNFFISQSDIFRYFGAPNESLRLIILYYMFKYLFGIKKFAKVTSEPKKPVKDYISEKLVIRSLFSRDVTFYSLLEL